jgi:redox-sensitive bicupin YhaK (pirin superfamily)
MNTTTDNQHATITKRPANERGETELGWLHSRHTFSFGEYYDTAHMGFRSLRVINDDIVEPGMGFGTHPHRDAEIFSYVIEGQLEHKDSLGNGSVITAGNLQYISAGSGVLHSEFNSSRRERVHFLQIWLQSNVRGGEPRYAEKALGSAAKENALTLLFSGDGRDGSVAIRQDAEVSFGRLNKGGTLESSLAGAESAYIHVIKGDVQVLGQQLGAGDGAAIENAASVLITADSDSEFLFFSLK